MKFPVMALMVLTAWQVKAAEYYTPAEDKTKAPAHLIALEPGGQTVYEVAAEKLGLKGQMIAKVVMLSGLDGNRCLAVREVKDEAGVAAYEMVTAVEVPKRGDKHGEVETKTRRIGKDLAIQVQRIWARALLDGRPKTSDYKGVDGCDYGFSATVEDHSLWGEVWSPRYGEESIPSQITASILSMQVFC